MTGKQLISIEDACEWLTNNLHLVRDWSGTPAQNYRDLVKMFREEMLQLQERKLNN